MIPYHCKYRAAVQTTLSSVLLLSGYSFEIMSFHFSTFLLVDKNQGTFSVNVYNMSENYGLKIGDNVAIPEPHLLNVQVKYKYLV